MHTKRGFTLIEIMVVVVILGVVASFSFLSFGNFGSQRKTLMVVEQFRDYLKSLQQRAVLSTATYGVLVQESRFSTYIYNHEAWQIMPASSNLREQKFAYSVRVVNANILPENPQIVIDQSGDVTDFKLQFNTLILKSTNNHFTINHEK